MLYFSQKPTEHQTDTGTTPIQCELLSQGTEMLKSDWGYFEVNILFHCDLVQRLEKSGFTQGHFQV